MYVLDKFIGMTNVKIGFSLHVSVNTC